MCQASHKTQLSCSTVMVCMHLYRCWSSLIQASTALIGQTRDVTILNLLSHHPLYLVTTHYRQPLYPLIIMTPVTKKAVVVQW
jgi:hypothetical protein